MDSKTPASVKIEQPEVYIEYPGQEMHPSSESYPSISRQEDSQTEIDDKLGIVKQELSDTQCEDSSQRFSKMIHTAGCGVIEEMAEHSNTESRVTENGYKPLKKHDKCTVSENVSSMIEINEKLAPTTDNCQLQNVYMQVKHTATCMEPLEDGIGCVKSSPQGMHEAGAPYTSDVCFLGVSLNNYNRTVISPKPYKCDECGTYFGRVDHLKCHMRTHTREKPYKCNECGTSFARIDHLKCHMRTHTGEKPYKCDDCGASFRQANILKSHKRIHTGEKPYKCDECNASFTVTTHLKIHKRTHTGEKPYKCDYCIASFAVYISLKRHMRIHTGEKPYQCDDCGALFTQSWHVKRHMKKHTGEKP